MLKKIFLIVVLFLSFTTISTTFAENKAGGTTVSGSSTSTNTETQTPSSSPSTPAQSPVTPVTPTKTLNKAPSVRCKGLPGCKADDQGLDEGTRSDTTTFRIFGKLISELIKYIAVIAVIAVMISGMYYLVSAGEDEKVKKAKKGITWALIGTFISITAYIIINILNKLSI